MKSAIYLFEPVRLKRKDNTLHFEYFDKGRKDTVAADIAQEEWEAMSADSQDMTERRPAYLPVERVDSLHVYTDVDLNSSVLQFLSTMEIPLHVYNSFGYYSGSFVGRAPFPNGKIQLAQWALHEDMERRLSNAKEMMDAALCNLHSVIQYYRRRGDGDERIANAFDVQRMGIFRCGDLDAIRGVEGTCRRLWYQFMDSILKADFQLDVREYNPPTNPVNALLSFLNGMVYTTVISELYRTLLSSTIGLVHAPSRHAHPLAYDLAELFKPILSDSLLVSLIRKGMVKKDDFESTLNGCYLTKLGRAKVVSAFENRLRTTIQHRTLQRSVSYRRLIRLEAYKLVNHMMAGKPYEAFRTWW
jgi:CRISPR-associated protein Cas1